MIGLASFASLPWRLLALVLALGGSLAFGYHWGSTASTNAHQADQNRAARVAQERFDAEQLRGQAAVASLTAERLAFGETYTELQEQFHDLSARVSLIARPLRAVPAVLPPGAAHGERDGAPPVSAQDPGVPGDGVPVLSHAAVWMWNSALAGADQPSGACGSADTSEAACAAASPLSLDDAWRNHAINAQRCAENRLNHQRLIDFINNSTPKQETAP